MRNVPYLWIKRLNIVKISVVPNLICRFSAIPIKNVSYFVDIEKLFLNFMWRGKIPGIASKILKEKNKIEKLTLPDFMTFCKATEKKTVWY